MWFPIKIYPYERLAGMDAWHERSGRTETLQITFCLGPNLTGGFASGAATLELFGPRNCGCAGTFSARAPRTHEVKENTEGEPSL
jgi:hypothetical protein